jgi:hypothetical protein
VFLGLILQKDTYYKAYSGGQSISLPESLIKKAGMLGHYETVEFLNYSLTIKPKA